MKDIKNELRKFSTIVEQSPVVIFTTDLRGNIEYVNPYFTQVTGYEVKEVLGKNPRILKSGKQPPEFYQGLWQTITAGKVWRGSFCNCAKDGREFWEAATISPVCDEKGEKLFYVSVGEDITQKKWQSDMIEHMAMHDGLTRLPNRLLLADRLMQAIEEAKKEHLQLAILYIDVDYFKAINDGHGHECGDAVLKEIGARLSALMRETDMAARLGGDEFVVMLKHVQDKDQVDAVAKRILNAFAAPIKISKSDGSKEQAITLSIGVSFYPSDATDAGDLLKKADLAMYEAKKAGKNRFYFYQINPAMI